MCSAPWYSASAEPRRATSAGPSDTAAASDSRASGFSTSAALNGFSPEASFSSPPGVRTAHAQWRGPCTRTPFWSAMPPSGMWLFFTRPVYVDTGETRFPRGPPSSDPRSHSAGDMEKKARAELEVVQGDALVRGVDEAGGKLGLHRPHGEEAVGDRSE